MLSFDGYDSIEISQAKLNLHGRFDERGTIGEGNGCSETTRSLSVFWVIGKEIMHVSFTQE